MPLPSLVISALETALNRYLRLDPDTLPKLAALSGKVIGLELVVPAGTPTLGGSAQGLQLSCYFLPSTATIQVTDSFTGTPDVIIRGTPFAFARQARLGARGAVNSGIEIKGDTQLGKTFYELLTAVDIDWEEQTSYIIGDAAAHQLGNLVRGLRTWSQQAVDTLFKNTAEYLQEEARELPPSGAVGDFLNEVDTLRNDVERLQARIHRLQTAIQKSSS